MTIGQNAVEKVRDALMQERAGHLYAKRDHAYREWLEVTTALAPAEEMARRVWLDTMKKAFDAGWAARKRVDYAEAYCLQDVRRLRPLDDGPSRQMLAASNVVVRSLNDGRWLVLKDRTGTYGQGTTIYDADLEELENSLK